MNPFLTIGCVDDVECIFRVAIVPPRGVSSALPSRSAVNASSSRDISTRIASMPPAAMSRASHVPIICFQPNTGY
jgi:hypothetical protein